MGLLDLDHQSVQVDDRIHRLQRTGLPRLHLLQHRVGDIGDRLVGQLGAQGAFQMGLNIPNRHATRIQADDHVRQPTDPALPLRHQPRLEAAQPVPRRRQIHVADLGAQSLRGEPIAGVARAVPGPVMPLIPQVIGQLGLQAGLQDSFHQLGHETALPGQLQIPAIDLVHQIVQHPRLHHLVHRLPGGHRLVRPQPRRLRRPTS